MSPRETLGDLGTRSNRPRLTGHVTVCSTKNPPSWPSYVPMQPDFLIVRVDIRTLSGERQISPMHIPSLCTVQVLVHKTYYTHIQYFPAIRHRYLNRQPVRTLTPSQWHSHAIHNTFIRQRAVRQVVLVVALLLVQAATVDGDKYAGGD